uniref:E3 ubiquitin-protein transferase MAEA n=1 Tax=Acrobeloides nanus TaxID=290746 RepID=A0A914DQ16_9BILA
MPVSKVSDQINTLVQRLNQFEEEFDKYTQEEIECVKSLQERTDYLKQGLNQQPNEVEFFRKQRLNRFVIDHLLRAGYFETAQKLTEYSGLEAFNNAQVFHVAKQVEQSLSQGDLSIVLAWITENRSKLHRLDSDFETEIRIQQCIELIKNGRRMDAIAYMRKYFQNLPENKWKNHSLMQLMGLIGFGIDAQFEVYKRLVSEERWAYLVERFRMEHARIFQLSSQSAFSACLQAGITAHKTPNCKKDPDSKCIVCSELFDLAEGLPYAHASNSRLICAYSGDPLNEQNQPLILPNGRVYGENTIKKLSKDGKFECPRTNEVFSLKEISRIFVL